MNIWRNNPTTNAGTGATRHVFCATGNIMFIFKFMSEVVIVPFIIICSISRPDISMCHYEFQYAEVQELLRELRTSGRGQWGNFYFNNIQTLTGLTGEMTSATMTDQYGDIVYPTDHEQLWNIQVPADKV